MIETARRKPAEAAGKGRSREALPFRAAPHNIEAEQALLGAILVNNEAHDRVSGFLEAHHFYDPLHQQIYETLSKLIASGKQATPITLQNLLRDRRADRRHRPRCRSISAGSRPTRRPSSTRATTAAPSTTSPPAAS